jgi:poly(ADP-ribose) glycohydrolase
MPNWRESKAPLGDVEIVEEGCIEAAHKELQLDFAHKLIGGGVLGHGCVQEEIRFAVCPELLLARMVCEEMGNYEAVIISGARQYSAYTGYGHTFRWSEPHDDKTQVVSSLHVKDVCVLALDATNFNTANLSPDQQYYPYWCAREINKAYVGFRGSSDCVLPQGRPHAAAPIATGNWGCGVFGGNLQLKALLQLCAASEVHRKVRFFTFGHTELASGLRRVWAAAKSKGLTVGDVYSAIIGFQQASESHDEMVMTRMTSSTACVDDAVDVDSVSTEEAVPMSPAACLDVFGHLMTEML